MHANLQISNIIDKIIHTIKTMNWLICKHSLSRFCVIRSVSAKLWLSISLSLSISPQKCIAFNQRWAILLLLIALIFVNENWQNVLNWVDWTAHRQEWEMRNESILNAKRVLIHNSMWPSIIGRSTDEKWNQQRERKIPRAHRTTKCEWVSVGKESEQSIH